MYCASGYYHRLLIKCIHSSVVKDTWCYYGEREWQIQAADQCIRTLYPFLCHTCCISFVTGIYFVAFLGTKQTGSNHNVSDLHLGSIYSKSSQDYWICWDLHIIHYFNTPTKCTLHICYIYFLLNLSYMFQCVIHHPQGELCVCAQK